MDIKHEVLQSWKRRADRARDKIEELKVDLAYQTYELEITQRVLAKADDDMLKETWQEQAGILEAAIDMIEYEQNEQREELAICAVMIAELEAELAVG